MQNAMQQTLNATKADTNTRKAIAVATICNEAESIDATVASATKKATPIRLPKNCHNGCGRCGGDDAGKQLSGASGYATGGYVSGAGTRRATAYT